MFFFTFSKISAIAYNNYDRKDNIYKMNSKLVVGIGLLVVELLAIELLGYWGAMWPFP
jgi:hypothetical protein